MWEEVVWLISRPEPELPWRCGNIVRLLIGQSYGTKRPQLKQSSVRLLLYRQPFIFIIFVWHKTKYCGFLTRAVVVRIRRLCPTQLLNIICYTSNHSIVLFYILTWWLCQAQALIISVLKFHYYSQCCDQIWIWFWIDTIRIYNRS